MTSNVSAKPQAEPAGRLLYGHCETYSCLAVADGDTAAEEAREITAIASARTWGEARRVAARHTYSPAGPDSYEPDEPSDDEPFDVTGLEVVIEHYWPGPVTTRALTLLPADLQARFGTDVDLNGTDALEIPLAAEDELVAILRERGFEVTRDDDVINVLNGDWPTR
jgi:hypothetical protein